MRLDINFWVECAKFQKQKGLTKEESWKKIVEPRLKPPTVRQIQRGSFTGDPKRDEAFAKIAWAEVFDGIPRPYASPEDVVEQEKDTEIKKLEALKVALEKDETIKKLQEEVNRLTSRKKNVPGNKGKVSTEG